MVPMESSIIDHTPVSSETSVEHSSVLPLPITLLVSPPPKADHVPLQAPVGVNFATNGLVTPPIEEKSPPTYNAPFEYTIAFTSFEAERLAPIDDQVLVVGFQHAIPAVPLTGPPNTPLALL